MMKRYFYMTVHFLPNYEETTFKKCRADIYIHNETEEMYVKRPLYDFGWGQEIGFELLPRLSFEELLALVEKRPPVIPKRRLLRGCDADEMDQYNIWRINLYGAVAVIMEDYTARFIDFLSDAIETDYFSNPFIRENFKCFSFSSKKTFEERRIPGGSGTQSYEEILNAFPEWKRISIRVIEQVYGVQR